VYKRYNSGLADVVPEVGSLRRDGEEFLESVGVCLKGRDSVVMVVYDVLCGGRPAPCKKKKKALRLQRRRTC
jgi:hypothetical protein